MGWLKKVTRGSVTVAVSRIERGCHAGSYRVQGKRDGKHCVFGVYKKQGKAIDKASAVALRMSQNDDILASLTDDQKEIMRAVIRHGLTLPQIERLAANVSSRVKATVQDVCNGWVKSRLSRHDFSLPHQRELRYIAHKMPLFLGRFALFGEIEAAQVDAWLLSLGIGSKRFKNIRGNLSTLWKWAVARGYAAENIINRIETPKIKRRSGGHAVISPRQFATLLDNVSEPFIPWLVISGFAGLRVSEICGSDGARVDRLRWEDFDWERGFIIVRPETSKTSRSRHVPVCSALADWLSPWKKSTGYVHNVRYPNNPMRKGADSETQRLGKLIGGQWPRNCLRASRASYRVALTGDLGAVALEGGHSANTLRREYLNTRFKEDAELWFSLTPGKVREVITGMEPVSIRKRA